MCHETAYQTLHVQVRGELRRALVRTPRADRMRDALTGATATLPARLKRSLAWGPGGGIGRHHEFTAIAAESTAGPRKTPGWDIPAERLAVLLATVK
ncbi:hypothetical protein AB0B56_38300 [Streptosporangium canum]|uniref:hypothetical protein n=1 Tax=Streptosporangium canum TaxID=324952 RepID=UPI00343F03B0